VFWMIVNVLGGMVNGTFGLPMKFTVKWRWENTWSMWTIWTLLVVPWVIGLLTVPRLFQVYSEVDLKALALVFLFGIIWGVSAIAFGTGMHYLGLALGYSLMMGMIIAIGSVSPLILHHPENIFKPSGLAIVGGVVVIIAGITLNARSAVMKEKDLAGSTTEDKPVEKKSFLKGVIICIIAGVTAPMLNYAFIYGDKLRVAAENLGASKTLAPNSIWTITLFGGFFVNLLYCLFLLKKNNTWSLYRAKGTSPYYLYTLIMGVCWAGGIAIYGMATANMGNLGPSIGWAIFSAVCILTANIWGILTGEWKGATKKTLQVMTAGLVVLFGGICIVGWAKYLS
jgi:L-rhamnose-H+ transport protein